MTDNPDLSILHYLVRVGVLDDGHKNDGLTFLDWQHAYQAITGARISSYGIVAEESGGNDKASCYLRLVRMSGQNDRNDIELALKIQPVERKYHATLYNVRYRFVNAFDRMGREISKIHKDFGCARKDGGIE